MRHSQICGDWLNHCFFEMAPLSELLPQFIVRDNAFVYQLSLELSESTVQNAFVLNIAHCARLFIPLLPQF